MPAYRSGALPRPDTIGSTQPNPKVNRMLSHNLDQLAALVPQYLHHGEFEPTADGTVSGTSTDASFC